uniref:G protein-coupled receptor n=1 Tax=Caenorhabditis tropicalis TaxID=1561998 RepID=A0A1I7SYA4_9PELO
MEAVQLLAQKSCAVLSFAINSLLIQLILFRSPKGIGMYKFLMVYISVFELIYAFLGLMVQPDFLSHSSVFLVIARTDRLGIPLWMIRIVNTMFRSMFGMSMAMFTLHFIYRYFVIIGSPLVKMDSISKVCIWFLSPIIYGFLWGVILISTLGPNESTNKILKETFFQKNRITIDQVTYIGPNYYTTDHNGTETFNWTVFGGMSVIITMVSISILTIVIFAYKSYKGVGVLLRESHHSDGYKTLQSQLLNMLVAQVSIPAILMHGPASFLFTGPIFHVANEFAGDFFCISVAVYPVLDPLPTMFMIQHYRQVVCRLVLKCV